MNKQKTKLVGGTPVHVCTVWDTYKGAIYACLVIILVIDIIVAISSPEGSGEIVANIIVGFFSCCFWFGLPVAFIVFSIYIWLGPSIISGHSIKCNCPYCKVNITYSSPFSRLKCPSCKKEFGLHDGKIYKITKENIEYFASDIEKTNILLQKQLKTNRKSNFELIKELKQLFDDGVISKEEFEEKKKNLLK